MRSPLGQRFSFELCEEAKARAQSEGGMFVVCGRATNVSCQTPPTLITVASLFFQDVRFPMDKRQTRPIRDRPKMQPQPALSSPNEFQLTIMSVKDGLEQLIGYRSWQ